MAKLQINMSEVQEATHVAPGKYPGLIGKVELVESADKTSHNLKWTIQIADGPNQGASMTMFTSLKQNALWRLKGILRNLGFSVDGMIDLDVDEDTGIVVDPPLAGTACVIDVVDDTYNNILRSVINDVLPADTKIAPVSLNGKLAPATGTPAVGGLKLR